MERNHNVQVGDIFVKNSSFELYSAYTFCQVVRLKGKTMVECRELRREYWVEEGCCEYHMECLVKPLPGRFVPEDDISVYRVYLNEPLGPEDKAEYCLHTVGGYFRDYLHPYKEERKYTCSGYGSPFNKQTWKTGARKESSGGPLSTILPLDS